jgi:hypothetical protein
MHLSESQRDAMLTLANSTAGQDFVPQVVLDDLISMKLVFWRSPDQVGLTPSGEQVYQGLAVE